MNRRDFLTALIGTACAAQFTGCSQTLVPHRAQIPVFGTLVDMVIFSSSSSEANQAITAVEQKFLAFHRAWHAWEQGGIVSKINQAIFAQQPIAVAESVKEFILVSQRLCRQSDGLFDPGIGKLIELWGFHSETWQGPPPARQAIQNWLSQRPSILDVYFTDSTLLANNPGVQLDFGGNAKGLALDIAMQTLQQQSIEHALVSIGGDMKALGLKPNQQAWQVAIQDPQQPENVMASLPLLADESVVTSGTYQRYFDWQGTRYSHLLNPNTGWPVTLAESFVSVTVIHANATRADAAATALLIAGHKNWQKIATQMQITMALAIDANNQIYSLPAIQDRIHLIH